MSKNFEIRNYFFLLVFLILINIFFYFFSEYLNFLIFKFIYIIFFSLEIILILFYNLKIFKYFYIFFFFIYSITLMVFSFVIIFSDVAFRDRIDSRLEYNKLRNEKLYNFNLKKSENLYLFPGNKEIEKKELIFK